MLVRANVVLLDRALLLAPICWCEISLYYQRGRYAFYCRAKTQKPFYEIMIFLIFLEKNIFGDHEKRGGTDVVPTKWTQMIKSVMTQ